MYSVYNSKLYDTEWGKKTSTVILYSYTKDAGFSNHIDPWGNESDDFFSREVPVAELDYLYSIRYEIKYKGIFFRMSSALNQRTIGKNWFEIYVGLYERKIGLDLGFVQTDKFQWTKELNRQDIEALKILEIPEGPFSNQNRKTTILEGQEIDTYFASLTD